jgi:hypothetical protein
LFAELLTRDEVFEGCLRLGKLLFFFGHRACVFVGGGLSGPFAGFSLGPECLGDFFVVLSQSKILSFLACANLGVINPLADGLKVVAALFAELGELFARCVVLIFFELCGKSVQREGAHITLNHGKLAVNDLATLDGITFFFDIDCITESSASLVGCQETNSRPLHATVLFWSANLVEDFAVSRKLEA